MSANTVESLLDQLQDGDRAVVRRAVDALVAMAPREPLLADRLERRLADETVRWKWPVAYTLGRVIEASEACLNVLAEGLGSEDQDVRWATQRLLTELGAAQSLVYEALLGLSRAGIPNQRRMAVYCLRDIGLTDERNVRAIVAACSDPEALVRVAAVTSLVHFGRAATESSSLLRQLAAGDTDERVRNAARFALGKVGEPISKRE